MALKFEIVPVTPFQQNCSILWCDKTRDAAIIDPGGEVSLLQKKIEQLNVNITQILLTHGHLDHVGGTHELANRLKIPVVGPHVQDAFLFESLPEQSERFGFPMAKIFEPDQWLNEGDDIAVGESQLKVIHAPGHTPGHIVFVCLEEKCAWVGDVLFHGSIGRTDFPRGDHKTLIASIKNKLFPLGDEIVFVPGHGPNSTFGHERKHNPYVADQMPIW